MTTHQPGVFEILFLGIFATATLDLWALSAKRLLGRPAANWGHVGRWIAGIPAGTFRHADIASTPAVSRERTIGWSTHYAIGIVYAAMYLTILRTLSQSPGIFSAALFGVLTVLAPWLILQPGLGAGYFARRTPRPNQTRLHNLISHAVFGLGLYFGWALLQVTL